MVRAYSTVRCKAYALIYMRIDITLRERAERESTSTTVLVVVLLVQYLLICVRTRTAYDGRVQGGKDRPK